MASNWFRNILIFASGWFLSLMVWRLIRISGIKASLEVINVEQTGFNHLLFILVVSIIAGFVFGSVQYYYEYIFNKKVSFRRLFISALIVHITVMLFIYIALYFLIKVSKTIPNLSFTEFIFNATIGVNLLYSLIINSLIIFVLYLGKLFGRDTLIKMITGRFYHPKEELRLFMFLDLRSSTLIAEKLGHIKYSALIQDCFYDLSVLENTKANVYQYVGDEVVLTWQLKNATNHTTVINSLNAFYSYKQRLEDRQQYYTDSYGLVPEFKAGLHQGLVTTVEVGSLKKEIAYHGDTMNIASRIQGLCKVYNEEFLISEVVWKSTQKNQNFTFKEVDQTTLKGKTETTKIYAVEKG